MNYLGSEQGGELTLEANRTHQCEAVIWGASSPKHDSKLGHQVLEQNENTSCLP